MVSTFLTLFFIALPGTFLVLYLIYRSGLSSRRNCQETLNTKALNQLSQSGFRYTKIFYLTDNATVHYDNIVKKQLLINDKEKQIYFIDYERSKILSVHFSEILNYQIYENGDTLTTGAHAGLGLGIFGAQTTGMCKELKLMIRLKRYDNSQITYNLISNTYLSMGINKSTETYKECISSLQNIVSFLEVVINENRENK